MIVAVMTLALGAMTAAGPAEGRQHIYDGAQAAFDKGDWAAAETGFGRLLAPPGRSSRTDGIIRSRYAQALAMQDRTDEAVDQARRAADEFPAAGTDAERAQARMTLARLLHIASRLDEAGTAFAAVRDDASASSEMHAQAAALAIEVLAVYDPPRAIIAADRAIADPGFATAAKTQQAAILSLKARAQLNAGDARAARATIAKAVALSGGGTTTTINLLQSSVRSDAALIYARAGDEDQARQFLAYSGSGYLPRTGWWGDGNRQPPVCGDQIKPEDVAVVAFSIDEAGRPTAAEAVYASRPGPMGGLFAAAVRGWEPSPTVGKLSPFWRSSLRIEMRCVTRPAPLAIADTFREAAAAWWEAQGGQREGRAVFTIKGKPDANEPPVIARIRAIMADGDAKNRALKIDEVLASAGASAEVRAYVLSQFGSVTPSSGRSDAAILPDGFEPMLSRLAKAPDGGRAVGWLRLEAALMLERNHRLNEARTQLDAIVATPEGALARDDAIRMMALLHLSMIDERQGAGTVAAERLRKAGLDAEQCSLFDVRPLPVNQSVSDGIFPQAALRWAMEGFVKEAFDIGADGRVTDVRTIIAYPPFVFGKASEGAVARFRYQPPTLDGKVLGCSANTQSFRFNVPTR